MLWKSTMNWRLTQISKWQPESLSTPTGEPELHHQDNIHFPHRGKQSLGEIRSFVANTCYFLRQKSGVQLDYA